MGNTISDIRLVEGVNCQARGIYNVVGNILWGTTWSPAEVNASTSGVNIEDDDATAHEVGVDGVIRVVHYTPAAADGALPRRRKLLTGAVG